MDQTRIGIVANTQKEGAASNVKRVRDLFERRGLRLFMESNTAGLISSTGQPLKEMVEQVDLILLLGGDGTILQLAQNLGPNVKPIAAINIGTLGFLTLATTDELEVVLDMLLRKDYLLSKRSVISARTYVGNKLKGKHFALNEVVIGRGRVSRLVKVKAKINGQEVTCFNGDGLIVSTPTGSTAYSLSAGGPVTEPEAKVFILNPVCAHSLASRPLVISDQSVIEIETPEQRDEVFITYDGQETETIQTGTRLVIRQARYKVPLITAKDASFYKVLRQKLDWSGHNTPKLSPGFQDQEPDG